MSGFLRLAAGIDTLPVQLDLHRAGHLWDANPTRRLWEGTPHAAMRDIWVRFRPQSEIEGLHSHGEEHRSVFWPAWAELPSLRPMVRALKNTVDAVELGSILITRLPPGGRILPHNDRGAWAAEFYNLKLHVTISGESLSTCAGETVRMVQGECWTFDNLLEHAVENPGPVDRIVLIVSMRVET